MYGLTDQDVNYLKDSWKELKEVLEKEETVENLDDLLDELNGYLAQDVCLEEYVIYIDPDHTWTDYIYTDTGGYVQSLYDKILDWYYDNWHDKL